MTAVSAPHKTHTTFSLTLTLTPGLPNDEELTHSIMDGMSELYLHGLQEYLLTLGIETETSISLQRVDYVEPD